MDHYLRNNSHAGRFDLPDDCYFCLSAVATAPGSDFADNDSKGKRATQVRSVSDLLLIQLAEPPEY